MQLQLLIFNVIIDAAYVVWIINTIIRIYVCSILAVNKNNIINNNSNSNNIIIIPIASTSSSKLQQQYTQSKPNNIHFIRQLAHIKRQILGSSSTTNRVKTDNFTSHKALSETSHECCIFEVSSNAGSLSHNLAVKNSRKASRCVLGKSLPILRMAAARCWTKIFSQIGYWLT